MSLSNNHPVFNERIFWDVNIGLLDYDSKADFVIERVFTRGDVPDIRACRRYYGDNKIKKVLTHVKWMPLTTVYLACALFGNELTDYRCYNSARSNPTHWTY